MGGRAARLSTHTSSLPAHSSGEEQLQQPRALSLLLISFFLPALIFVVQESREASSAQA